MRFSTPLALMIMPREPSLNQNPTTVPSNSNAGSPKIVPANSVMRCDPGTWVAASPHVLYHHGEIVPIHDWIINRTPPSMPREKSFFQVNVNDAGMFAGRFVLT